MSLTLSILSHLGNVEKHAKLQGAMLHALRELAKRRGDKALQEALSEIQGEQVSLITEVNWINADIGAGKAVGEIPKADVDIGAGKAVGEIPKADVGSQELELHPANWSAPQAMEWQYEPREEIRLNRAAPQRAPTVEELERMQRTLHRAGDHTIDPEEVLP